MVLVKRNNYLFDLKINYTLIISVTKLTYGLAGKLFNTFKLCVTIFLGEAKFPRMMLDIL